MKANCPNCQKNYDFKNEQFTDGQLIVHCEQCGTRFKVRLKQREEQKPGSVFDQTDAFGGPANSDLSHLFDDVERPLPQQKLEKNITQTKPQMVADNTDALFGDPSDLFELPEEKQATVHKAAAKQDLNDDIPDFAWEDEPTNPTQQESHKTNKAKSSEQSTSEPSIDLQENQKENYSERGDEFDPTTFFSDDDFPVKSLPNQPGNRAKQVKRSKTKSPQKTASGKSFSRIMAVLLLLAALLVVYFIVFPQNFVLAKQKLLRVLPISILGGIDETKSIPIFPIAKSLKTSEVLNRRGFTIYVVEGVLENQDTLPHSFIRLEVKLLDADDQVFATTSVYAGNQLTPLQLKTFSAEELDKLLQVEMGDQLQNFNINPKGTVQFMAAFIPAPPKDKKVVPLVKVIGSHSGSATGR